MSHIEYRKYCRYRKVSIILTPAFPLFMDKPSISEFLIKAINSLKQLHPLFQTPDSHATPHPLALFPWHYPALGHPQPHHPQPL